MVEERSSGFSEGDPEREDLQRRRGDAQVGTDIVASDLVTEN